MRVYRDNGKIPATYEVIYGHAWKNEMKLGAIFFRKLIN